MADLLPGDRASTTTNILDTHTVRRIVGEETQDLLAKVDGIFTEIANLAGQVTELTVSFKAWRDTTGNAIARQGDQIDSLTGLVEANAKQIGESSAKWDQVLPQQSSFMDSMRTDRADQNRRIDSNETRLAELDRRTDSQGEQLARMQPIIQRNETALLELPTKIEDWIFGTKENGRPSLWRQLQGHSDRLDYKIDQGVASIQNRLNEVATDYNLLRPMVEHNQERLDRLFSLGAFISSSAKQGGAYVKSNWKRLAIQGLLKVVLPGGAMAVVIKVLEVLVN